MNFILYQSVQSGLCRHVKPIEKIWVVFMRCHQFCGQANQHLQDALQNTGIEVVFNVGRTDAKYTAKQLSWIDPLQVKHEVADEYAVEKTHPVF